jgi:hypothetical protein
LGRKVDFSNGHQLDRERVEVEVSEAVVEVVQEPPKRQAHVVADLVEPVPVREVPRPGVDVAKLRFGQKNFSNEFFVLKFWTYFSWPTML